MILIILLFLLILNKYVCKKLNYMFNKYLYLGLLGLMINVKAQNCTPQTAGSNAGDTGCVSLIYQNKNVFYKTVRAADGNEWLQQNLGSTNVATSIADEGARGDYFQYGRWDDGHQLKNSQMSETYPTPNNPVGLGSGTAIFYIGGGSPWSSNYTGWFANPDQNDNWTAKNLSEVTEHNGMDPCKAIGDNWEMPSEVDWDLVMRKENIFPKPDGATNNGMIRGFESNLKIAGAGARKENVFSFDGTRAYLWTRSASGNPNFYRYAYLGVATSSTNGFGGDAKSFGYSVRCVNKSNNTLAVNDFSKSDFSFGPNPADKFIKINTDNALKSVEVLSVTGQKISETKDTTVDVSRLTKGNYFIKITFENGKTTTKKFIKK